MQKNTRICSNPKLCAEVRPSAQCACNLAAQRPRHRTPTLPSAPCAPKQRLRPGAATGGRGPHWGLPCRRPSPGCCGSGLSSGPGAGGCPWQGGGTGFIRSRAGTSCAPSSARPSGGSGLNYRAGEGVEVPHKGFPPREGLGACARKRHLRVTFPRLGAGHGAWEAAEPCPRGGPLGAGCRALSQPACVCLVSQRRGEPVIQGR